ncbi:MAPEG family protein [Motiliproteus sp.]|uniref:MAPEG family protein n=1 Tax=Motiliproteus sp. TaxID=1898955 RepID=UPI003BADB33F
MLMITPLYAGLLALLFVGLSVRTLLLRRKLRVAVGDGGDKALLRAMRVHANFVEYVPISLILIAMLELSQISPVVVHALGLCLLLGRLSHAYGVSQLKEDFRFRVFGMALTFAALVSAAFINLLQALLA